MSPVVHVAAGAPSAPVLTVPELARALPLSLAELVAAARIAGDVPLPFGYDDSGARLAARLAGGEPGPERLRAELEAARVGGPADAALVDRGLVVDGCLAAEPAAALHVLAGGRVRAVVDLALRRGTGVDRLHCWLGVEGRLVARLATSDGLGHELGWHDVGRWSHELARIATLPGDPATRADRAGGAARPLPAYASFPSDLVVAAGQAVEEGRSDLVAALVAQRSGPVRVTGTDGLRDLDDAGACSLLRSVLAPSARLRVVAGSGRDATTWTLAWLGFAGSWHELAPGPRCTTVLRSREPDDLGERLAPLVARAGGADR